MTYADGAAATALPSGAEWRAFAIRTLHAAGLGAVGAGVVFFVAANWQEWGLMGRFALLQLGLLLSAALALWRPPPRWAGQGALLIATLLVGGLLALFGQSYQTGADVYELFFTWGLLALPFALAAASGAVWAVWWVVLNVALGLLFGGLDPEHAFWWRLGAMGLGRDVRLMIPCVVNLLGLGLFMRLATSRYAAAAPAWLLHALLAVALSYGALAALPFDGRHPATLWLYLLVSLAVGAYAYARLRDVFALTAVAASWILISTVWLMHKMHLRDASEFFIAAMWLIASSTLAAMALTHCLRAWRTDTGDAP